MPHRPKRTNPEPLTPAISAMQVGTGARIAAVRGLANLTQQGLADLLRVDRSAVAKWEKGSRMADPYKMAEVCARFRITMDFLYRGRLEALPRDLALTLALRFPELVAAPPPGTALRTDTDPA